MNNSPRRLKPRPETQARRQEILAAATEIFGAKGYANGTLADIADQVGMTHAGILHHFGTKDQLLLEVLRYRDDSDVEDLEEQHIPGGIELFRHLVKTAALNSERAGIVQTFVVLSGDSVTEGNPGREYFEQRYRILRNDIIEAFRVTCSTQGVSDEARIEYAAAAILAVMDGLQVQWLLNRETVDLAKATQFAIEAIVRAVLEPGGPDLTPDAEPVEATEPV